MWEQALDSLADKVATLARAEGLTFERIEGALEPGEPYAEMKGRGYSKYYLEPAEWAERASPAIVRLYEYPPRPSCGTA